MPPADRTFDALDGDEGAPAHSGTRRFAARGSLAARRRILIIIENLPVPLDRRAWQQACALGAAGYDVTIICPRNSAFPKAFEIIDGIEVFRHPLPVEARRAGGYVVEYAAALFWELALSLRLLMRHRFDAIQAGNPPDTIFLIGAIFKLLCGTKFVFDYRDLSPELLRLKFGRRPVLDGVLRCCESLTLRTADRVIANNGSFAELAIHRGGKRRDEVAIVRHGPDLDVLRPVEVRRDYRCGRRHLVLYVGVMGSQDGVDLLLHAARFAVHVLGRDDIQFLLVGAGPELAGLRDLARALDIADRATFTGFLVGRDLFETFSSADLGAAPDPKNPVNDLMSMNKILEYMAFGLPTIMFDLVEGRALAGDCALYASANDPPDLARQMVVLLDDAERRRQLGERARARAAQFAWATEKKALLDVYESLWHGGGRRGRPAPGRRPSRT